MIRPKWKSKVFDELHAIREEITKEMKNKKAPSVKDTEEMVQKDGYQYLKSSNKYRVLKKI
ncbi:MAG: hypothetical protein ACC630_07885 [Nitrospinota bacterium]